MFVMGLEEVKRPAVGFILSSRGNGGATDRGIEFACKLQHGIANSLSFKPAGVHMPKQFVIGIEGDVFFHAQSARVHLISFGSKHDAVQSFHVPIILHEVCSKPIEELGMRG